jgi:hypothetical protein
MVPQVDMRPAQIPFPHSDILPVSFKQIQHKEEAHQTLLCQPVVNKASLNTCFWGQAYQCTNEGAVHLTRWLTQKGTKPTLLSTHLSLSDVVR